MSLKNICRIISIYHDIEIDSDSADILFLDYNITCRSVFIDFYNTIFKEEQNEKQITQFIQHFTQTNQF